MSMWRLPWAWLLLVPWTLVVYRLWRRPRRVAGLLYPTLSRLPPASFSWRLCLSALKPVCWTLGLLLLILAAAGPQGRWTEVRQRTDAIAIQMVVDVSGSMEGLDFSPQPLRAETLQTRLDVVKTVFADFISRRPHDLIGLTTFGGYATTRSPLTVDHAALRQILARVDIPREDEAVQDPEITMTAIGDALASASARLRDSDARSRIIILLSDGESNTGVLDPLTAVKIAESLGIRIYVVGIGTDAPVPFLTRGRFGRKTLATAPVTYDESLLRKIADRTGGLYYHVNDADGLEQAMHAIDQLETTAVEQTVYHYANPFYLPFAASGALLVFLGAASGAGLLRRIA